MSSGNKTDRKLNKPAVSPLIMFGFRKFSREHGAKLLTKRHHSQGTWSFGWASEKQSDALDLIEKGRSLANAQNCCHETTGAVRVEPGRWQGTGVAAGTNPARPLLRFRDPARPAPERVRARGGCRGVSTQTHVDRRGASSSRGRAQGGWRLCGAQPGPGQSLLLQPR